MTGGIFRYTTITNDITMSGSFYINSKCSWSAPGVTKTGDILYVENLSHKH